MLAGPDLLAWKEGSLKQGVNQLARTDPMRGKPEEIRTVTGAQEPEACASLLGEITGASAIVTLGSTGAIDYDGALHTTVPKGLDPVNPSGAGDFFDAGLRHGLLESQGLSQSLAPRLHGGRVLTGAGLGPRPACAVPG